MKMKKITAIFCACAALLTAVSAPQTFLKSVELTVSAEKFEYGEYLKYKVKEGINDEVPTIEICDCDKAAVSIDIPAEINGMKVTSIGYMAINWCQSLESVTIPDTVTSIGAEAFYWCNSLKSIVIPESVTSIGADAFHFCDALEDITIPASVTSVGIGAFSSTAWLKARQAENPFVIINNILIDGSTCSGDAVIPYNVTSIGAGAFKKCNDLKNITLHEKVASIGQDAFFQCKALESITIKDPLCVINDGYEFPENSSTIFNDYNEKTKRFYNGVIYGLDNSTAQKYSEICGFKFESVGVYTPPEEEQIKGDISGNGKIDLYDAIEIAKFMVGKREFTEDEMDIADFNADGKVDLYDAIGIAKYMLNK